MNRGSATPVSGSTMMKVAKTGGTPVLIASGNRTGIGIAVGGGNVYWAELGTQANNFRDGAIWAAPAAGGTPVVGTPQVGDDCSVQPGATRGNCRVARFPVTELSLDLPGPAASELAVVDGVAAGAAAPGVAVLGQPGWRGVDLPRPRLRLVVIESDAPNAAPGASLSYTAPANALHVVLDAPQGTEGRSDVAAVQSGGNCQVTVSPHAGSSGGFDARPLMIHVASDCSVSEDSPAPFGPPGTGTGGGFGGSGGGSGGSGFGSGGGHGSGSGTIEGGCAVGGHPAGAGLLGLGLLAFVLVLRRRHR